MGGTAILIAVAYGIATVIGLGIAIGVASSTFTKGPMDEQKAAHRERNWLLIVITGLVVLLFATIFFIPYGKTAPKDSQVVNVTGFQFGWLLSQQSVKANVPVEFVLTSKDVNHDFAVYDSKGVFLFQIGVVPNYTQKIVHTFAKPGRYDILCFEYCGVGHTLMEAHFEVTP
jgi:cytochrome c oxidase subunit 2